MRKRHGLRTGDDGAATARRIPRLAREAEALLAFGHAMALVVVALDLGPVVAACESGVGRLPEGPRVVRHGVLGDSEALGDLRVVEPAVEQVGYAPLRLDVPPAHTNICSQPKRTEPA